MGVFNLSKKEDSLTGVKDDKRKDPLVGRRLGLRDSM